MTRHDKTRHDITRQEFHIRAQHHLHLHGNAVSEQAGSLMNRSAGGTTDDVDHPPRAARGKGCLTFAGHLQWPHHRESDCVTLLRGTVCVLRWEFATLPLRAFSIRIVLRFSPSTHMKAESCSQCRPVA